MKWKVVVPVVFLALAAGIVILIVTKPGKKKDNVLIYARGTDSTTLDPAEVEYGEDAKVTENVFETLVNFKGDTTELEGRLATSWTVSDDKKTITFQLRKGVKFHDGTPFNGEAVAFTFGRLIDPNHPHRPKEGVPYADVFAFIDRIEGSGETAVFHLKRPVYAALHRLALFGAAIVSPDAVKKLGKDFSLKPCGTGPYKLTEWQTGVRIVLDRFEDYWGSKPEIRRVVFIPAASAQTAIEKLKTGEIQIADNITPADVKIIQAMSGYRVEVEAPINVCYLGFNSKKFPYNHPDFRRAVALALNRDEINQLIYYGQGTPAKNLVPPSIWADTGELPPYEFDLAKAKEHLGKVGLPSGFTAELWHMSFARPYVPEPDRLAECIQSQLRKIGLELRIQKFEKAAWGDRTRDEAHPMYLLGWNADYPDPDNFLNAILAGGSQNSLNNSFWENAEFNDLVSRAEVETDAAKRKEFYLRAVKIYREELPTVPLIHVNQLAACPTWVKYNLHPIEVRLYPVTFEKH